jgi:hypothetical protein
MIYVAGMAFRSTSEDGENDTEGHFTIVGEARSADDMLDRLVPEKLEQLEKVSELDYVEFFLTSLVELKDSFKDAVVLGFVEETIRDKPAEERTWDSVVLASDQESARSCDTTRVSPTFPFAVIGKPPLRLRSETAWGGRP